MRATQPRLTISILALALALGACSGKTERLEEHLSRGAEYLESEQYSEAIIEYKNVLQIDPNHADAHFGLARAFLRTQRTREGFWELRETVRLDSTNLPAKIQFGQISLLAGEHEEALKQASEVVEADSTKVRAYLLKALALDTLGRPEEALEVYKQAVEVDPNDRHTVLNLANHYRRRGRPDAAAPLYEKLVEISPISNSYSQYAGFLSQERTQDEQAEVAYKKALELAENAEERQRAYGQLAGFFFSRDRFDQAVESLEIAMEDLQERGEDSLDTIYLLARFYRSREETEKADALIEEATRANPDDPRPFLILSAYRGRKGDVTGALEAAKAAMAIDPKNSAARLRTAEVLVELGHEKESSPMLAEGRGIVEAMLAVEPTHPGALFVKGKIELAAKDAPAAIATLRAAINAKPDWAQPHFVLGAALAYNGEPAAARGELARALEIDAGLLDAHKVLAGVHHGLREYEYAVDAGRRYLREKPDDVDLRILVAQSLVRLGEVDEALEELKQISDANRRRKHSPDILRTLYSLDRLQNRQKESIARVQEALNENPDNARLHRLRGLLALDAGRASDAERSFIKALELAPDDIKNYEMLARLYATTGRTEETITTYEKALKVRPTSGSVHHFLGVLYELSGERDRAVERYEDAIRYDPNLAEPRNNLAYLFAEEGENLDRALDMAQEAKALLPDNPNTADTLGWVLFKRGIPSAAISYLREAEAGTDPGDGNLGVVRHHLALAYEANGEQAQAVSALERALGDRDRVAAERKAAGAPARKDPVWVSEARAMLDRLRAATG